MESIIWALDLAAVAYLCLWALRTDKAQAEENQGEHRQGAQRHSRGPDNA